jgi:short-subunit dehydrogenase
MTTTSITPRAVVTGASGGIGLALAERLARKGHETILVARSAAMLRRHAEELQARHGVPVHAIAQDLTGADGADELWSALETRGLLPLDVLVNNAGFGTLGAFADADPAEMDEMIRLNVSTLVRLTHHALRGMRPRGSGRIVNVASTAAFQPGPFMAVYFASKAFVLSFSEALAEELRGTGVTVTALCPGPVPTGFQSRARMGKTLLTSSPLVQPVDAVADVGMRALERGRRVAVPGWLNRLVVLAARITPRPISLRAVRRLQESRDS